MNAPRTLLVAPDGVGPYTTVQAAVDAAEPGDTVWLQAGVYIEDVYLRQGVTLRGENRDATWLQAAESNALQAHNITDVTVTDLTLDGGEKEGHCAVWIAGATVHVDNCAITGGGLSGIEICQGAKVLMQASTCEGNTQVGVYVHDEGFARLEGVCLKANGHSGLAVKEQGRVEMRASTCEGSTQVGVYVYEEGFASLEGVCLKANGYQGLGVKDQGRVEMRESTCEGNTQSGVYVYDTGEVELEAVLIADNGLDGLEVRNQSQATLHHCTIVRNAPKGLWVRQNSQVEVRHSIISDHAQAGISLDAPSEDEPASRLTLEANCLWANEPHYEGVIAPAPDLLADPCFVDADAANYDLRPDSPCIGVAPGGRNLGSYSLKRPSVPESLPAVPTAALEVQLRTWPLCHTQAPTRTRPALWLRAVAGVGARAPLCLIQDLGSLLSATGEEQILQRPGYLPPDLDTSGYVTFLRQVAAHPLVRTVSTWDLSDAVIGALVARVLVGAPFSLLYALPQGADAVAFGHDLDVALEQSEPAEVWVRRQLTSAPVRCLCCHPAC